MGIIEFSEYFYDRIFIFTVNIGSNIRKYIFLLDIYLISKNLEARIYVHDFVRIFVFVEVRKYENLLFLENFGSILIQRSVSVAH